MEEFQFRKNFVRVLAERVGRYFYEHDPYADIGADSRSMD
jgi:hypothetical protein